MDRRKLQQIYCQETNLELKSMKGSTVTYRDLIVSVKNLASLASLQRSVVSMLYPLGRRCFSSDSVVVHVWTPCTSISIRGIPRCVVACNYGHYDGCYSVYPAFDSTTDFWPHNSPFITRDGLVNTSFRFLPIILSYQSLQTIPSPSEDLWTTVRYYFRHCKARPPLSSYLLSRLFNAPCKYHPFLLIQLNN